MKRLIAAMISVAIGAMAFVPVAEAQSACPPELSQAKDMLSKKAGMAKSQDTVQAPRSLAGARQDMMQAPRSQDTVQAPRSQDTVQAPRSLTGATAGGSISNASSLIKQAEAACKAGDMKTAKEKAEAAVASMK